MSDLQTEGQTSKQPSGWGLIRSFPGTLWAYLKGRVSSSIPRPAPPLPNEVQTSVESGGDLDAVAGEVFRSLHNLSRELHAKSVDEEFTLAARLMVNAHNRHCRAPKPLSLQDSIDELPADLRRVWDLHVKDELNFQQIAERLNLQPKVALALLRKAVSHVSRSSGEPNRAGTQGKERPILTSSRSTL